MWSVVNIDTLDDRALFTRTPEARDYTCDDANFCIRSLARDITGCSVKADARGRDIGITTVGSIDEARHRVQRDRSRGERNIKARRLGRKEMVGNNSVALQVAQRWVSMRFAMSRLVW